MSHRFPAARARCVAALLVLSLVPVNAAASEPERPRLRVHLPVDLGLTLGGSVAWLSSEVLKPQLAPAACRWCAPPGLDRSLRDALRWQTPKAADVTSYVTGFALAPLAALGLDALEVHRGGGTLGEFGEDALVIAEAVVIAADVNQLVKFAVGRERPFVHKLSPAGKLSTGQPSDNNLSFFSGHTTLAFSAAVSSGMIASLKGYRSTPVIWATGLTLASATGYLRIAADKHYATDVLLGALWGSAVGVLVPWLHRPKAAGSTNGPRITGMSSAPLPGGGGWLGLHGQL